MEQHCCITQRVSSVTIKFLCKLGCMTFAVTEGGSAAGGLCQSQCDNSGICINSTSTVWLFDCAIWLFQRANIQRDHQSICFLFDTEPALKAFTGIISLYYKELFVLVNLFKIGAGFGSVGRSAGGGGDGGVWCPIRPIKASMLDLMCAVVWRPVWGASLFMGLRHGTETHHSTPVTNIPLRRIQRIKILIMEKVCHFLQTEQNGN